MSDSDTDVPQQFPKKKNPFPQNPRERFRRRMLPIVDKLYYQIIPALLSINRFDKSDDERHLLDREFAIDAELTLDNVSSRLGGMLFTLQEKFRTSRKSAYDDVTVEYYNDPTSLIEGDWFNLAAQLYFCGYASADELRFDKWIMLDWARVVLETYKGNIDWQTKQNRYTRANFNYTPMCSIPNSCIIAIKLGDRLTLGT